MDPWAEPDETKLAELLLYVAEKELDDLPGGATKVNKILFFAEFSHIRAYGVPITGEPYQKLENGPAPRHLAPIRDRLIAEDAAYLRIDDYFGRPLHRLVPKRPADLTRFTGDELRVTDQVVQALWGKTAKEVSDMSHEEMGWRMVEEGEDIPLPSAFLAKKAVSTEKTRTRAQELSQRLGLSG
ncbi:MAG TPA: Panacea domain-containing protein [Acidimicrobiales bacterium]|nr:Panacea domain-containing protein [Acidimicrobiales bacterium]